MFYFLEGTLACLFLIKLQIVILSSELESDTCIKAERIFVFERPLLFSQAEDEYNSQGFEVERVIVTKLR